MEIYELRSLLEVIGGDIGQLIDEKNAGWLWSAEGEARESKNTNLLSPNLACHDRTLSPM